MPANFEIRCARCGKTYSLETVPPNDGCGGRIEFKIDIEDMKGKISRDELERRCGGLWKYIEFMPLVNTQNIITLGEGNTPLLRSTRLAEALGLQDLYLKNETVNPTGSFKDRPISVGVNRAFQDGGHTVVSASSGNAATSMAAYAAKGGLRAVVFVPEHVPRGKLTHLLSLDAQVFRIKRQEKGIDPTTQLLWKINGLKGWIPVPSFGPFNGFQFEGTKTLGYEIVEQLKWHVPDWILFPTGSGGLMAGTMKGLFEFYEMGLIDRVPRPVVVQPEGCGPIVKAFKRASDKIEPWGTADTICGGLADPLPWDGDAALRYLQMAKGYALTVPDYKTEEWLLKLGKLEGLFAEPSGVAGIAGLEMLIEEGIIDAKDRVVVPITGIGFKDLETTANLVRDAPLINPDIQELNSHLRGDIDERP